MLSKVTMDRHLLDDPLGLARGVPCLDSAELKHCVLLGTGRVLNLEVGDVEAADQVGALAA